MSNHEDLRYPIGHADTSIELTPQQRQSLITDIRYLPSLLELMVQNLDEAQLNTPYRPGGWTVAQVVHHVADSHMNALVRLKLALTEDNPQIKPYEEQLWAELEDVKHVPINVSLTLLHALHVRWVAILERLTEEQWQRTFFHPASKKITSIAQHLILYAWHGKHHLAHIEKLVEREGWPKPGF
ncbi:DinB family protein [Chitinophaga skermanii]|uniref:DinB family protein n=1 Tax=Chitinophaga skermanii TaxID=331697 RepID=A0A327QSG8_9BACT|nr:putative metal-dependent hydrolase [Chitinophaga skermanii]RAJ06898.1 DinB family protein [Chitinophaga skermanii]